MLLGCNSFPEIERCDRGKYNCAGFVRLRPGPVIPSANVMWAPHKGDGGILIGPERSEMVAWLMLEASSYIRRRRYCAGAEPIDHAPRYLYIVNMPTTKERVQITTL